MAISKAQQAATAKYKSKNYDRIALEVKKGSRDILKENAEGQGESLNGYIKKAVFNQYKQDTGNDIDL